MVRNAVAVAVIVGIGPMTSGHLEYASTTTRQYLPSTLAKSTWTRCHGRLGKVQGCKGTVGGALRVFTHWLQQRTVSSISASVVIECRFRHISTHGACFCRAACTPRGKCTLIFVFPTPRRSRTPLIFRVLPACVDS